MISISSRFSICALAFTPEDKSAIIIKYFIFKLFNSKVKDTTKAICAVADENNAIFTRLA